MAEREASPSRGAAAAARIPRPELPQPLPPPRLDRGRVPGLEGTRACAEAPATSPPDAGALPEGLRRRLERVISRWPAAGGTHAGADGVASPWRPSPPSPELVRQCQEALERMPVGYQIEQGAPERRERTRRRRVLAGRTTAAPAGVAERDRADAACWERELQQATGRGWAQLAVARAQVPLPALGRLLGRLGPSEPTAAGLMLGGSFGTQQASSQAVTDCLEQAYLALTPQRRVIRPWLHWVGAYGGKAVGAEQMGHDAMSLMHGMGVDPRHHLWSLFGHGSHWHLVLCRVRDDGRTFHVRRTGVALRTTVDALDAESGCRTAYRPGLRRGSKNALEIREDRLCAELVGSDAAGRRTVEALALQGPAWAARVAPLGAQPGRVCGLLVLPKPSYRNLQEIVRHCIDA